MLKILIRIQYALVFFLLSFNLYAFPGDSIYNLESKILDKDGKELLLENLSGKVQVFSMIYTRCKTVCPIIVANMKSIERLIPKNILDQVSFSLVSLDPDRDSVENLYNFFNEKKLNNKTWNLYKMSKEETLQLALTVGIKYKKEKNNEYTHSNLIIILDKNGVIRMHHQGLDKNYSELVKLVLSLSV